MLFDLEPKTNLKDLYDFEQPFSRLMDLLKGRRARAPLITITGPRRVGKTSLIKTALAESGFPHIIISGNAFADKPAIGKKSLMVLLERELNDVVREQKKWKDKLLEVLRGIKWVRVDPKLPWVHFEWERPIKDFDMLDVFYSLNQLAKENKTKFLLVFDEAQEFRRIKRYSLQKLMAYTYDNLDGIQIIVSGSQFGFLHDFLEIDDPRAPLYGRGILDINVPRLSETQAVDFLQKGFEQAGIRPRSTIIESAVEKLDGIVGWLTFFGSTSMELGACTKKTLNQTAERGSKLSLEEFRNFLKVRPRAEKRYISILEAAARVGRASWVDLKRNLEIRERKAIADKIFNDLLGNLINGTYLQKNEDRTYSMSDPMLTYGLTRKTRSK